MLDSGHQQRDQSRADHNEGEAARSDERVALSRSLEIELKELWMVKPKEMRDAAVLIHAIIVRSCASRVRSTAGRVPVSSAGEVNAMMVEKHPAPVDATRRITARPGAHVGHVRANACCSADTVGFFTPSLLMDSVMMAPTSARVTHL
jgi:hypothetical protein